MAEPSKVRSLGNRERLIRDARRNDIETAHVPGREPDPHGRRSRVVRFPIPLRLGSMHSSMRWLRLFAKLKTVTRSCESSWRSPFSCSLATTTSRRQITGVSSISTTIAPDSVPSRPPCPALIASRRQLQSRARSAGRDAPTGRSGATVDGTPCSPRGPCIVKSCARVVTAANRIG